MLQCGGEQKSSDFRLEKEIPDTIAWDVRISLLLNGDIKLLKCFCIIASNQKTEILDGSGGEMLR